MPPPTLAHRYVYIANKCRKFLHCGFHFPRVSSSQPKLTITPMATSECLALTRDNVGDGCVELRTTSKIILDRRIPNIAKIIDWHRQPSEMSLETRTCSSQMPKICNLCPCSCWPALLLYHTGHSEVMTARPKITQTISFHFIVPWVHIISP